MGGIESQWTRCWFSEGLDRSLGKRGTLVVGSFYSPYYFVPVARGSRRGDLNADPLRESAKPEDSALDGMRHDRYEPRRHSGVISCTATARSPIFIGDKHPEGTGTVTGFTLGGNPALPASSLRGLISSLAEAASNSAPRILSRKVLGQECYSYRKPMNEALSAIGRLVKNGEKWRLEPLCLPTLSYGNHGRLDDSLRKWISVFPSGPVFKLYTGKTQTIGGELKREIAEDPPYTSWTLRTGDLRRTTIYPLSWTDVMTLVPGGVAEAALNIKGNARRMAVSQRKDTALSPAAVSVPVVARVLGCYEAGRRDNIPETKKHEVLIPLMAHARRPSLDLSPDVLACFQQLADQMTEDSKHDVSPRPYEPKDTRPGRTQGQGLTPQNGDLVFFDVDDRGTRVTEIAYSSIWRKRVNTENGEAANAWSFFTAVDENLVPLHRGRTKLTLAERVFGFIEEKTNADQKGGLHWKGRVRFSHGISTANIQEMLEVQLKELSGPKPPSPAMYFRQPQAANRFIAKRDLKPGMHWPQGRKFYLHHPGAINQDKAPWRGTGEFVPARHVKVKPWPKGSQWKFEIRFDNLSDLELGMMLYALKPQDGFLHKLGMGKPIGLGSVEIKVDKVETINRQRRYTAEGWGETRFNGGELDWTQLRKDFRDGMHVEIRAAIEKLGDPNAVSPGAEISYPVCIGNQAAGKHYEWFVANEERARRPAQDGIQPQALQPVAAPGPGNQIQAEIKALRKLPPPHQQH